MVNAGAIATADLMQGATPEERLRHFLEMMARYTGRHVSVDAAVFLSENLTGHRNRAIAHLMLNFGMVQARVEESLDLYFQQCSVSITSRDLATMAATIANGGLNPINQDRALASRYIKDILSIMYTCGMYNYAGEWAYRIGLPAKSGVAGGILAVIPEQMGIGVFSPLLDSRGNSLRGIKVCEELSERFKLHCFDLRARGDQLRESLLGSTKPLRPITTRPA
jgi:glutaminase